MNQVLRVLQLYALLAATRAKGMHTAEIARKLEVDERSVRRWITPLNELADMQLPHLPFQLPELRLSLREGLSWVEIVPQVADAGIYQFAAAHVAVQHFTSMDDDVIGLSAGDVLDRVAPRDEAMRREILGRVQRSFHYRAHGPKLYHETRWLDVVVQCIVARQKVTLHYRSAASDETKAHHVEPYTLVLYREAFYLLARQDWGDLTTFAIERIERMERHSEETFVIPDDFDPSAHFEGHFGIWRSNRDAETVVIAFEKAAARSAKERQWPGTKEWRELSDGRWSLTLEVPVTPEVEGWVLSWGPTAEVLEPAALRQRIAERAHALCALYA